MKESLRKDCGGCSILSPEQYERIVVRSGIEHLYQPDVKSVAFCVSRFRPNELCFALINDINKYVSEEGYNEAFIFYNQIGMPPKTCLFGTYPVVNVSTFEGNLIFTELEGLSFAKSARLATKFFYVYDANPFLKSQNPESVKNFLVTEKIRLIVRNETIKKRLEKMGLPVYNKVYPLLDIAAFIEELQ